MMQFNLEISQVAPANYESLSGYYDELVYTIMHCDGHSSVKLSKCKTEKVIYVWIIIRSTLMKTNKNSTSTRKLDQSKS